MIVSYLVINGQEVTHISADERKILINKDGIMSESVYLEFNDSVDNWQEIDKPEEEEFIDF